MINVLKTLHWVVCLHWLCVKLWIQSTFLEILEAFLHYILASSVLNPLSFCFLVLSMQSFFFFNLWKLMGPFLCPKRNFTFRNFIKMGLWRIASSLCCQLFISLQFSCSVMSDSLRSHGLQHPRLPCPSPTPGVCSDSCWVGDASQPSHPLSSPSPPSFNLSQHQGQFFRLGGQSIGVSASASVLPMNIQDWFPLRLTGLIFLQSKGLSRVFSNTTVQKHQFFGAQLSS